MRISDWSSDVCSSDLASVAGAARPGEGIRFLVAGFRRCVVARPAIRRAGGRQPASLIPLAVEECLGDEVGGDRGCQEYEERDQQRSEEHTSELQSLMRISYAVFCLKQKNIKTHDCS